MDRKKTRKLIFCALMIALVFVSTRSIQIPIPFTQGYIHAGDSMIFVAAILLGWEYGAVAGGVGSALADLVSYPHWALPTLIIKTFMGALVGWIAKDSREKGSKTASIITSIGMASIWFGFMYLLRYKLSTMITPKSTDLLGEIDGAETMNQLLMLSQKVQSQLLWAAILIPLVILVLAFFLHKVDKELFAVNQLLGMMVAGLWMVLGYYVAAGIMYGTFIVPIFSIPWNIVQFVMGAVIGYLIILALKKTPIMTYID